MIVHVLPEVTALFLVLFARTGALVMLMPGIGEATVSARVRLALALLLTLLFYPLEAGRLPAGLAGDMNRLIFMLVFEVLVGLGLGLIARLTLSVAQIAGAAIAFNIGLGFAQSVDPTQGQQGMALSSFLSVVGVVVIFTTDLHHLAIAAIVDSYKLFPPGAAVPVADFRDAAVETVAGAFLIGVQIAAPFMVFALVFNLGIGILQRLMPQFQVYFLTMPVTILTGIALMAVLVGTMMRLYQSHVAAGLMRLVVP